MKYVYEFTNKRKVTEREFIRWFEKKFFYTIRKFNMVNKGDIIKYSGENNFRDVVLEYLLKMLVIKFPVKLVKSSKKVKKIAFSDTTDIIASKIINEIFKGDISRLKIKPVEGKIIRPLYLFLDKEVLLYAKLRNLKFKKEKGKKDNLNDFINELELKHLEIKHSIVKSYLGLI